MWLTGYVTDFLTRAKEQGFAVNPQGFSQALDRLQNFIAYAEDFQKGGEDRAYALYVLARNGRAPIGDLRYYSDTRLDRFSTPLAKAQLGAALAMMGDKTRAEAAFASALDSLSLPDATGLGYRADYGSDLRDSAALVTLASETRVTSVEAPKLVNVIAKAYVGRTYTSTQEQAWMLLAANALAEEGRDLKLIVNGAPVVGAVNRAMSAEELLKSPLTVANDGAAPVDAVVSVIGSSLTTEPPVSKGFTIERTYYTLDGQLVDLKSATGGSSQIKQNERLVAVVKVEIEGCRRPCAARRPAARRLRDRQPAHRRQRRRQGTRLAEDHRAARALGVPRRPLRRRLQLLKRQHRAGEPGSGIDAGRPGRDQGPGHVRDGRLHGPRRHPGCVHPSGSHGRGHVSPGALRPLGGGQADRLAQQVANGK